MKRYLSLFILLATLFSGHVFAKEYTVRSGLKANIWNDFLKGLVSQSMHFSYDNENKVLLWYVDYPISPIAISISDNHRVELLNHIKKYKEWNKKASAKGMKLEKEIGTLPATKVWFKSGNDWTRDNSGIVHVKFFSQSPQKHQLIIYLEELQSVFNEYVTSKPETLYLWWNEVIALENALSNKAVESYITEVNKKESIEKDFQ